MAPNKPGHTYRNPGLPIVEEDWRPATVRNVDDPEQIWREAFALLGRDYGGPLPADFVLHAVLQSGRP
jgi:hypothetical protein